MCGFYTEEPFRCWFARILSSAVLSSAVHSMNFIVPINNQQENKESIENAAVKRERMTSGLVHFLIWSLFEH